MIARLRRGTATSAALFLVAAILLAGQGAAAAGSPTDRDGDGMPNTWERAHGLDPRRDDANQDPDGDRLKNLTEYVLRTKPRNADTDGDGLSDGLEVKRFGGSPRRADTDGDGVPDGWEDGNRNGILDEGEDGDGRGFVGVVVLYDAKPRELVIELAVGWPMLTYVPADARIRWVGTCARGPVPLDGVDIEELYFRGALKRGMAVVDRIFLACPGPWK